MKLLNFFILFFILFIVIENKWIIAEIRTRRQAPLFLDWTAPRRGPSPQGGNGPYGPFGVGMAGLMQGILFGGR